jgi:chemotaxis response regulator CheB
MPVKRVLLVDDSAIMRSVVRRLFEAQPGFEVSGEAENGQEAIERAEVLGPEEIHTYQIYLTNEKKLAISSSLIAICALRFLYKVTLKKHGVFEEIIPAPKKPQKLPIV